MFSLSHCDFVSRNSLQCAHSEKTAKSRAEQSRAGGLEDDKDFRLRILIFVNVCRLTRWRRLEPAVTS